MSSTGIVTVNQQGLRVVGYPGDGAALLAMSLDDNLPGDAAGTFAGFAIYRTVQGEQEEPLFNRLNFSYAVTSSTTPEQRKWFSSADAPFQKFRWVDVPPQGFGKPIAYRVVAMYFKGGTRQLRAGPEARLTLQPCVHAHSRLQIAFTRAFASSQAYADRFKNGGIRPAKKSVDFDTASYQEKYAWLGGNARKALFGFLDECLADTSSRIDVFAYDLDEPDFIRRLQAIAAQKIEGKSRLRAVLDDASLHTKSGAIEVKAAKLLKAAAGPSNVKQGHFSRFQHHKMILKRDASGKAQSVLFGSMNFSLRGVYIQANNVLRFDDPGTADYFARAFDNAFDNKTRTAAFKKDQVSWAYNRVSAEDTKELPRASVAISPHKDWQTSLGPVADAIRNAKSSVLYAVMEPTGTGPVLETLQYIAAKPTIFSYGTVETDSGLAVQSGSGTMGRVTSFAYLASKVPKPFNKEWSGGAGKHIHHKFVVVDFNGEAPMVFTGSSNLAAGGEKSNGDSLIQIADPVAACMYMIEAVKLFDHYAFRKAMKKATRADPLTLWDPTKGGLEWWKPYYDKTSIRLRDRCLFAMVPLPAGVATRKDVDWNSIATVVKGKKKAAAGKKRAAKKKTAAAKKPTAKKKAAAKKKAPARKKKSPSSRRTARKG